MDINVFSVNIRLSHTNLHHNVSYERVIDTPKEFGNANSLQNLFVVNIPMDPIDPQDCNTPERVQIDTGAQVSCLNKLHIFHNYQPYLDSFRCPVRLNAAVK